MLHMALIAYVKAAQQLIAADSKWRQKDGSIGDEAYMQEARATAKAMYDINKGYVSMERE